MNSILDAGTSYEIDYKECITCGDCINSCPENRKKLQ
ncbi:4Fe-4S binding protein [Aceticella autotrophica]|uniref:4Fe-4S binding protein n=2 Tax=Aceticella autotrophica TaxID=2755338 RepID=A0A975AX06_9THEO|nr:4Fe-4S binding protein [Aceticella autotrophica]